MVKDHIPTLALVVSLAMILGTILILTLDSKADTSEALTAGLVGSVGTIVGAIAGFATIGNKPQSSNITTTVASSQDGSQSASVKEEPKP